MHIMANNLSKFPSYASLHVVQQPVRARMCGLGDKDRRHISPPPLVQLRLYDKYGAEINDISDLDVSLFAVIVELYSEDNLIDLSIMTPCRNKHRSSSKSNDTSNFTPIRNLIGNLVSKAYKLYDLSGNHGIWFIFQDLSIRSEGKYTLKFSFFNLLLGIGETDVASTIPIACSIFSEPFESYPAKKFPGVVETTDLSRTFAKQGARLSVRDKGVCPQNDTE